MYFLVPSGPRLCIRHAQALHRARCIGDAPKLPVFRLYLRGTVEERLLQRAAARGGSRVPTRRSADLRSMYSIHLPDQRMFILCWSTVK